MTINPELLLKIQQLIKVATDTTNDWAEKLEQINEKMASKISDKAPEKLPEIVQEKVEILKLDQIKQVANAYLPSESNGLAAYYVKSKDSYMLFMLYLKDRQVLPNDQNKLIVVESEALSREVENLLEENKVVIIK